MWKVLLVLSVDPFPQVAAAATRVVDFVHYHVLASNRTSLTSSVNGSSAGLSGSHGVDDTLSQAVLKSTLSLARSSSSGPPSSPLLEASPALKTTQTLKRSSSFANTIKSLRGISGMLSPSVIGSAAPVLNGELPGGTLGVVPDEALRPSLDEVARREPEATPGATPGGYGDDPTQLVLESTFFDWSLEYFTEPQMRVPEIDDPGSKRVNERTWRKLRNERMIEECSQKSLEAGTRKFDTQINILHSDNNPATMLCFHAYEPHLVGVDNHDSVIVYNWRDGQRLSWFSNSNAPNSRITSLKFINEEDAAMLMTGSDDGSIRIYRKYDSVSSIEMVSAWRAIRPSSVKSTLLADWQQVNGSVIVAGEPSCLRIWDVEREICSHEIGSGTLSAPTHLISEKLAGDLIIAGFADGAVHVYDRRLSSRESIVRSFREHERSVLSTQLQRGEAFTIISGSRNGDMRIWDMRQQQSVMTVRCVPTGVEMTAFSVHEEAPLFSCGTNSENIWVYNLNGKNLSTIRYNDGFLGPRIGHVGCLTFHPLQHLLAAGTTANASLNVFGSDVFLS
ncbi:hypothetical protein HK101_000200 [Irineochytrium annulatum]|nr:hypothetical protein HK101_000200 [Irineochytrium annulatum]